MPSLKSPLQNWDEKLGPIFQRVPGVSLILALFLAFLGPKHCPTTYAIYFLFLNSIFFFAVLRNTYGVYIANKLCRESAKTNWYQKWFNGSKTQDLAFHRVLQLIIIPNFKEGIDTLCETLDLLASHSRASSQYIVRNKRIALTLHIFHTSDLFRYA